MKCEQCGSDTLPIVSWALRKAGGTEIVRFCDLDCLSRWVEAQRPIAAVEERCVCCRGIRPCATLTQDNGPCCFECICQ